ncbi:MAG: V-type ATP synthase subunit I [Nanoarchaeota archaeon]|nr:V-type ATP synthase subunit I [Nanoarchaeota archaeon]
MQKIEIIGLNKDKLKILSELQVLGTLQITQPPEELTKELSRSEPTETIAELSESITKISRIKSTLELVPGKQTFEQKILNLDLPEKVKIQRAETKDVLKHTHEFLKKYGNKIIQVDDDYTYSQEKIKELKEQRKVAEVLARADAPLYLMKGTKNVNVDFGYIENKNLNKLRDDIKEKSQGLSNLIVVQKEKKHTAIIVLSFKTQAEDVSLALKHNKFIPLALPDVPEQKSNILEYIDSELKKHQDKIKKIKNLLTKLRSKLYQEVVVLKEQLEIKEEKQKTVHKLVESKSAFIVQGWIEEENLIKTAKTLGLATKRRISIRRIETKEEPPVKQKNSNWLKPFELLTELYALPKYKDIDPTFIVGPVFVIFAGFMLTDFVYGLGLAILGAFMLMRLVRHKPNLKGMSINIFLIGLFAMIFGVLTGSYLGDGLKILLERLNVMTAAQYAQYFILWNDPLADPLYFLILSMAVALIHLNIGLIIGSIEDFRKKAYKNFITSKVIWFVLQISVLFFYLGNNWVGGILLLLVVITIIYAQGPIGILGITGFMGDVISYSRLFALALSTAGIALTVNLLTTLVLGIPYAGIIAAILIFVIGHLFSFLMNSLGGFVHSIRLQFVEFFGKFYEGGGDKFEPFKENRDYTVLKKNG